MTLRQVYPAAVMDLSAVDSMEDETVIREALRLGLISITTINDDEE